MYNALVNRNQNQNSMNNLTPQQLIDLRDTAIDMCTPNNTITTLELKNELRKRHPGRWVQDDVSDAMRTLSDQMNEFDYYDNGTFRTYTLVGVPNANNPAVQSLVTNVVPQLAAPVKTPKPKVAPQTHKVPHNQLLDLIANSHGAFFSIQNTSYKLLSYDNPKGHITALDLNNGKQSKVINFQAIEDVRIGGNIYLLH